MISMDNELYYIIMGKGYKTNKKTVPYKMNNKEHATFLKFLLLTLYIMMPKCMFADYSGRHFESSSSDFLLILAFIVIVVIAIVLFISDSNRKPHQVKETVTSKQTPNYVPKVDIKNSTIVLLNVSALLKRANRSSYIYSELVNFSSFSLSKRNDIQKVINKGAFDAAKEFNTRLLSDSGIENELLYMFNMAEGQKEFIKAENRRKRQYYSPPSMYSEYYDLAYDTVMHDGINYQIKQDIEAGLIQCD